MSDEDESTGVVWLIDTQIDKRDWVEARLWLAFPGKVHGRINAGFETWTALDAGLVRHSVGLDTGLLTADLILWHDVRDVEVSVKMNANDPFQAEPFEEWFLLVQYPRIEVGGADRRLRDFALAVARLASEHH